MNMKFLRINEEKRKDETIRNKMPRELEFQTY